MTVAVNSSVMGDRHRQRKGKEISKILVPVDGSENSFEAAEFATMIAEKYDAEIIVLHVVPIGELVRGLGVGSILPEPLQQFLDEASREAKKMCSKVVERAEKRKVKATPIVTTSTLSASRAIVDYAERERVSLIVMGTRGESNAAKVLLGSVASTVVNSASCPVTVV